MINHSQHHSGDYLISWESKFGPNNTDANRVGASTDSVAVNTRPLGFFSRSLGQGCTTLVLRSWWWGLLLHKLGNDDDDRIRFFQVNWNTHTKYTRERPTTSRPSCTRLCKTLSFVPYTLSNILPTLCGITNQPKDSHTRPAVKRGGHLWLPSWVVSLYSTRGHCGVDVVRHAVLNCADHRLLLFEECQYC